VQETATGEAEYGVVKTIGGGECAGGRIGEAGVE